MPRHRIDHVEVIRGGGANAWGNLSYADLITRHIQKENGILFDMADQMLPPEEQARLEQDYRSAVPAGANLETGAHYEGIVETLCQQWNVDPREAASVGTSHLSGGRADTL